MKKTKRAIASLAIASMVFTMIPFNAFAESTFPNRLAGWTAEQTAVKIADQTGWNGKAILSSSMSYGMVDALTCGPLATLLNAPILLQGAEATLNVDTKAELIKLNITKVYVTSGTAVISQAVIDEIKGMNITVESLGGWDRFATSANIAQNMVSLGATVNKAAVAYGWLNQDALSIAAIASAKTEPILLTEKDAIPESVKTFLTANASITASDVIGGTAVISDDVLGQLPTATRMSGVTAYDTNLEVLKASDADLDYDHVFIANGETAIDALTGAPLAAKYKAGIVLVNGELNEGTAYMKGKQTAASVATALGGTAVISDSVLAGCAFEAPDPDPDPDPDPIPSPGPSPTTVATTAVVKAELSGLQADVTKAQVKVSALPAGFRKTDLQARLDVIQLSIGTAAVVLAETSGTQTDVTAAQILVTALPAGVSKTALQARLDAVQLALNTTAATTAVATAVVAGVTQQANIDAAQTAVAVLPAGVTKAALQAQLDAAQILLIPALAAPTAAVAKAELSILPADIAAAQILVTALTPGVTTTALQARLDPLIATNLTTANAAATALVPASYVTFTAVTEALAWPTGTPLDQINKTAAINLAIAALVTPAQAVTNLATASSNAAVLVPANYVDFKAVAAALLMPAGTPLEQLAKTNALNNTVAALVTVVDANLAAAKATAGALVATEYTAASYTLITNAVTAALALPATTDPEKLAQTLALTNAIALGVFTTDTTPPVIQLIGSSTAPTNLVLVPTQVDGANAYADPGAVANDLRDGNLTANIAVTYPQGAVNTSLVGKYPVAYTITDAAGNSATVTRTVDVVDKLVATTIPQFASSLLIPWAMPKSPNIDPTFGGDYYEIATRQFTQQVLPAPLPPTTVWGYGSATDPNAVFHAPSLTIEATANKPVRVKWINDLKDINGNYLPHLLPIDQTLDWANPAGGMAGGPRSQTSYVGPVPTIAHVHGAHANQESDGYPEAWYLPATSSIPMNYATSGASYDTYKLTAESGKIWSAGNAVFDYANDQRDGTIWYHDHAMGMTRTNVYAGPAGFYLIRGNAADTVINTDPLLPANTPAVLPAGAYEIPLALQDRTFNTDGSLYYPNSRENFDAPGYTGPYAFALAPLIPTDVAPIWNPEFFGDTIIVNGNTWPFTNVEQKRYRLRFLNGSQARTFILRLNNVTPVTPVSIPFTQIGSDGGFLPTTPLLTELLMGPAERIDVIVDFTGMAVNDVIRLQNFGPDGPYQGGLPDPTIPAPLVPAAGFFTPADPATTGQVMEFRVVADPTNTADPSTPATTLQLPTRAPIVPAAVPLTRQVSLNEEMSMVTATDPVTGVTDSIGPKAALLGTVAPDPVTGQLVGKPLPFNDIGGITENVAFNTTETWEIYNFTADAHPIHLHLVEFQVVNREGFDYAAPLADPITGLVPNSITQPTPGETGFKDTVMALPGQVTRIIAKFDKRGLYVWHCHILEHEDNEMMRPYLVK